MAIKFIGEQVKRPILKYNSVKKWLNFVLNTNGFKTGDICYVFCNDEYLKDINIKFLNHDYFTEIVTFEYSNENIIHGDMFISMDRVIENASNFECKIEDEFLRVMIHGLLHLIGYADGDEEQKKMMRIMENEYLNIFNKLE